MPKKTSKNLFQRLKHWNFNRHKDKYKEVIEAIKVECDLTKYKTILDVGCKRGALASTLYDLGLEVTAVDIDAKKLRKAQKNNTGLSIRFVQADALKALPFEDKSFDVVMTAHLAHIFDSEERIKLYQEMGRIAKQRVIIQDNTYDRLPWITFSEFGDGGNYYQYAERSEKIDQDYTEDLKTCFKDIVVVKIGLYSAWYICTPV